MTETEKTDWSKPQELPDLLLAFPASVRDIMPTMDEIPDEFKRLSNTWVKFQQEWFYSGLMNPSFYPRPGVDANTALRHLKAIQGSFEPKHEHKEAAVAYLASLWFWKVYAGGKTYGGE